MHLVRPETNFLHRFKFLQSGHVTHSLKLYFGMLSKIITIHLTCSILVLLHCRFVYFYTYFIREAISCAGPYTSTAVVLEKVEQECLRRQIADKMTREDGNKRH
ncbi:hypothetical protein POM88_034118 [Heracleum sosnowskyi]|uniref:Uncharacterized protein n=1 Tax=Heracleum sosnowskyi TaxID=360622 RepID=A0AAD8MBX9_9APIA|nr:hypothetical protein POM88_034118 [Heracleum sosnowskyi]